VLLQRGAARVAAIDVGYGQLHERLRGDPRVTVFERTNARELRELPFAPELVVCDVSFIGLRLALPPVLALAKPGWEAVVLVEPRWARAESSERSRCEGAWSAMSPRRPCTGEERLWEP